MFDPMNKAKWTSSLSDKVVKDVLHVGKVVDWDKKKSTVLSALSARQDCI
jgi:hypothetical protein